MTLDLLLHLQCTSAASLVADRYLMRACRADRQRAVLRVYDCAGDILSFGRYHLLPDRSSTLQVHLHRRLSGGRVMPFGDGFIGVSLVLPQRSALVADDPLALQPYQVLNRYVRGIMEACRIAGVDPFYAGRDMMTVNHRPLAWISLETEASGVAVFEAIIANRRAFPVLASMFDQADPGGALKAEVLPDATSLEQVLGIQLTVDEVAELLRRGYEKQFPEVCMGTMGLLDETAIRAETRQFDDAHWLRQRCVRPELDRHASTRIQLGVLEAHFAVTTSGRIDDILLSGDFIANSAAVEHLEDALRGCAAEWDTINSCVTTIFAAPQSYILGIGPLRTIADTICKGISA